MTSRGVFWFCSGYFNHLRHFATFLKCKLPAVVLDWRSHLSDGCRHICILDAVFLNLLRFEIIWSVCVSERDREMLSNPRTVSAQYTPENLQQYLHWLLCKWHSLEKHWAISQIPRTYPEHLFERCGERVLVNQWTSVEGCSTKSQGDRVHDVALPC